MSPRLLRPLTSSGFDPRKISGLVAWWDAQVASSYDIETGVSEWRDLSGNGHTVTQSITNNQPTPSTINGRTALLFDGSNDSLASAAPVLNLASTADQTVFFVMQAAGTEAGYILREGTTADGFGFYAQTNSTILYPFTVSSVSNGIGRSNNAGNVHGMVLQSGSSILSVDGAAGSSVSISFSAPTAPLVIGNRTGGTSAATFFDGRIGSLIFYDRALTASERQKVERWLGQRWGITVA
jgi:hypothetical protein